MSWMQKLHATYERCFGNDLLPGTDKLMPVSHTSQNVNIMVVLDKDGNFRRAELLGKEAMVIQATEGSAGRSGKMPPPHPLNDKVRYCAADYTDFGGQKAGFFSQYEELLRGWAESEHSHHKARAVHSYVLQKRLVRDLVDAGIIALDEEGRLSQKPQSADAPGLFKYLAGDKDQGDAMVCWSVEGLGPGSAAWKDPALQQAWVAYDKTLMTKTALCMVDGTERPVAAQHPRGIRWPGDGSKLISSNDEDGFTFRGKFDISDEASTVGYETSHKAHNALRWLIDRQGSKLGEQVVLAWAVSGKEIPNPVTDAWQAELPQGVFVPSIEDVPEDAVSHAADIGQRFSRELGKALAGYEAKLKPADEIAVLSLNSATTGKGRLSVVFYQEMLWADYLEAFKAWQEDCAWLLRKSAEQEIEGKIKKIVFLRLCAPTPAEISLAAHGSKADDKLKAATRERLLPCITDANLPPPRDLMESAVRRACNRPGLEGWEWETTLGAACALYRGFHARRPEREKRRKYSMSLEPERTSRDYLYGRLLAVAEHIEEKALYLAKEYRPTNAERLMQRFSDLPFSTWNILEKAVQPYRQRLLQTGWGGFRHKMDKLLDEIQALFATEDFISDKRLSGEFLLGYHCQRQAFWNKEPDTAETTEGEE